VCRCSSVAFLNAMLGVVILSHCSSVTFLNVILSVVMLSVVVLVLRFKKNVAERRYAECRGTECRGASRVSEQT
jgi:hypothetical protein